MRTVCLPSGQKVAALGQGTWRMGEDHSETRNEVAALRRGIERGMTVIDTAEMYGDGNSEKIVGKAISGVRDRIYLVSKVLPQNSGRNRIRRACEASLNHLRTDYLDLYLLHWRGTVPLEETIGGFMELQSAGMIRHFGVSNFDTNDMKELWDIPGGKECQTNQILYNLSRRWPEASLHAWSQNNARPLMVYSPLDQGRLISSRELEQVAKTHEATSMQVALAWTLRYPDMFVVPKASSIDHLEENWGALNVVLTAEDLDTLDRAFPPPDGEAPLEIL